jgi:hypothetical protein
MKLDQMFPSKYLNKNDLAAPVRATVARVTIEELQSDNGREEKPVIHFMGDVKPLILNRTNADAIASYFGDDSDHWTGKVLEVFFDPSVRMGNKAVGGVRVRVPQGQAAPVGGAERFDLSDGQNLMRNLTRDQVQHFLDENAVKASAVRVRPAGDLGAAPKLASEAGFRDGDGLPAPAGGAIPF